MTIRVMKLKTGEDIIAEFEKREGGKVKITSVLQIVQYQTEESGLGMMLMPYMSFAKTDEGIILKETDIIFKLKPDIRLEEEYKNVFSKIVTPPTPSGIIT
ncbi:MAG: hypothetical protein J7L15_09435 [Clostridiales bacterium]|nr:hypothetical protein [Clostridiales bacterium]